MRDAHRRVAANFTGIAELGEKAQKKAHSGEWAYF
jgi:hypothetical protein